jgi:hypothetical protein
MRSTGRSTGQYMLREAHLVTAEEARQVIAQSEARSKRTDMLRQIAGIEWRKLSDDVLHNVIIAAHARKPT